MLYGTAKDLTVSPKVNPKGRKTKRARLDKIIIPNAKANAIRDELNRIGINDKSVFPDLSGLGNYIKWKYKSF
jgi:hypothetical protein